MYTLRFAPPGLPGASLAKHFRPFSTGKHTPPAAFRQGAIRLYQQGVFAPDLIIAQADRPFPVIPPDQATETLVYRCGGDDFSNVRTILKRTSQISRIVFIDIGYTGVRDPNRQENILEIKEVAQSEGVHQRIYNFTALESGLARCFPESGPVAIQDLPGEGLFSAEISYRGKLRQIFFVGRDGRTPRSNLGIELSGVVTSYLKLPGYYGVLSNNPDFIAAVASDLGPGELCYVELAELNIPALIANGLLVKAISPYPLFAYQVEGARPEVLDTAEFYRWCVLQKS